MTTTKTALLLLVVLAISIPASHRNATTAADRVLQIVAPTERTDTDYQRAVDSAAAELDLDTAEIKNLEEFFYL